MKKTSRFIRLTYFAIAAILAALFFLQTVSVSIFGENVMTFSLYDFLHGVDIMGFSGEGNGFFAIFLLLPAVEAILAIPSIKPGMFITPIPWIIHIAAFTMSLSDPLKLTGLGRIYLILVLIQAVVFILYVIFAIWEAAVAKKEKKVQSAPREVAKRYCPQCHLVVQPDAKFCKHCGAPLDREARSEI